MINGADSAWLMMSSVLVLLMTLPALGFFYAGLVQAKNVLSVFIQCVALAGMISLLWFIAGYSLAFSGSGPWLGNMAAGFLANLTRGAVHPGTHVPESVYIMFQMTFAIITPALIIGAYVERIRFSAVLLFSGLWLFVVYVPVTHWIWGGGWLAQRGVLDFAGGIVVHVTAGVSALVVAWQLGPRRGFPHSVHPPHAPWMVMVGASLLSRPTPPTVDVSPSSQPSISATSPEPKATPIAVGAGQVGWVIQRADGSYAIEFAPVDQVCGADIRPDCSPLQPPSSGQLSLDVSPRAVVGSPSDTQVVVVASGSKAGG